MKLFLLFFLLFLVAKLVTAQTNFTYGQLSAPSDVLLKNYNTTDFGILLGNVTRNLPQAQTELVLTSGSQFQPTINIPIRIVIVIFDACLLIAIFLLRNYEPLKSKLFISLVFIWINIISHIPGSMDSFPFIRIYFQNYWNQYQNEKAQNPLLDAQTFYQNNLNSKGLPTWLQNYINFENVYCFFGGYLIYALIIAGASLYAIQVMKFNLLNIIKNTRQTILRTIEDFKRKQLEKIKKLKEGSQSNLKVSESYQSNLDKSENPTSDSTQSLKGTGFNIDLSSVQSSTSLEMKTLSARSSRMLIEGEVDSSQYDYEDIAVDLTSGDIDSYSNSDMDEISRKGKLVNFLKRVIKFRIVELGFVALYVLIWYFLITIIIVVRLPDKWGSLFNNWDSNSGYCRASDRTKMFTCDAAVSGAIFLLIPLFLFVDLVISISGYLKIRRNNKEKGEKTSNFLIYHFIESDPFVYRLESVAIIVIDVFCIVAYFILSVSSQSQAVILIASLFLNVGLNFIGGIVTNPGITIVRTLWNYRLAYKARKEKLKSQEKDSGVIQTIQQLVSSPISSYTIEYVISHKKERDLFYQYLKEEYSIENLLFIEDLLVLRKIAETQVRSKISKIKEMVKLYLSESDSIFEINVPTKVISNDLKDYKELLQFMNQENVKVDQLPRKVAKDSQTRYFPNIDLSKEESVKSLIGNLCKPTIFSNLSFEVYKNLMDSYYRFNNSRKWKEYLKSTHSQEP